MATYTKSEQLHKETRKGEFIVLPSALELLNGHSSDCPRSKMGGS